MTCDLQKKPAGSEQDGGLHGTDLQLYCDDDSQIKREVCCNK